MAVAVGAHPGAPGGPNPLGGHVNNREMVFEFLDRICTTIHDFCVERWRELRLCFSVVSSVPFACPDAMQNRLEQIANFHRHMIRRGFFDQNQKNRVLEAFQALPEDVRECFVDLSEEALYDYMLELNIPAAQKMLERFSNECTYLATIHRILMPARNFFFMLRPCSTDHSAERAPPRLARGLVPLLHIDSTHNKRAERIHALHLFLGEDFIKTQWKKAEDYICPITFQILRIPVVHGNVFKHMLERQEIITWLNKSNECPSCRAKVALEDFNIYVEAQQLIERELIDLFTKAPQDMLEKVVVERLTALINPDTSEFLDELASKAGGQLMWNEKLIKELVGGLITALPEEHGIRSRVEALYKEKCSSAKT